MIDKKIKHKGFTLIETLVAVMILATAVAGPLSIAARSLNNSLVAKDEITAFFLAQDAVEYVRYARDTNTLSGADWITGIGGSGGGVDLSPCTNTNGCYLDTTLNNPPLPITCVPAGPLICPVMNYDTSNSRFTYAGTGGTVTITPFTRSVLLTSISSTELRLTVTVSWSDVGGITRRVTVYENIFQWQ